MNVLWLVNMPLPEASKLMNERPIPFGGWLINLSVILSRQDNINLTIAFPKQGINEIKVLKGEKINYYAFSPINNNNVITNSEIKQFQDIIKTVKPNIIHIFGTEYAHTLAMVNTCKKMNIKTIISIQGLVSVIAKHYLLGIPEEVQRRFTFRDFVKQNNLKQQQREFVNRGKFEIEAIQKVQHIIGRTLWDKACTTQINSNLQYHFCNETLREKFYNYQWSLDKCERYTIFISQASYPIKGLHLMLEAMFIILKKFPKTKLFISGDNITKSDTVKDKLKKTSYAKYIEELINKYDLKEKIIFLGLLDESQMCERYLKSNVFVCPSTIENSPNSLGEAMILGVPCVASDVGGISDLLKHKEEGFLYQVDAPYMLAYYVCEIFQNDELALNFSKYARQHALTTYNRESNIIRLVQIYNNINKED